MSTEAASSRSSRWLRTGRLVGATLFCFLTLAVTIPNLGRWDPVTHAIRYGWPEALCIFIIVAPLILIFIGAARSPATEGFGWALLFMLLVMRFGG